MLADLRITRAARAGVVRDRYFDAVTIRIWAAGEFDWVVSKIEQDDSYRG